MHLPIPYHAQMQTLRKMVIGNLEQINAVPFLASVETDQFMFCQCSVVFSYVCVIGSLSPMFLLVEVICDGKSAAASFKMLPGLS